MLDRVGKEIVPTVLQCCSCFRSNIYYAPLHFSMLPHNVKVTELALIGIEWPLVLVQNDAETLLRL